MNYDFSTVEDIDTFVTIPEGVYDVQVGEVRVARTKFGDERWALRLDVADGDYAGRVAAWDGLTWNETGVGRVKYVLESLGLDVRGRVDIAPSDLVGRSARVELKIEEWENPATQRKQLGLKVPFRGYLPMGPESELEEASRQRAIAE